MGEPQLSTSCMLQCLLEIEEERILNHDIVRPSGLLAKYNYIIKIGNKSNENWNQPHGSWSMRSKRTQNSIQEHAMLQVPLKDRSQDPNREVFAKPDSPGC